MTKGSTEWFEALAAAMKARDKALNGIARWQEALADAEAVIQDLTEDEGYDDIIAPDSAPAPIPAATAPAPVSDTPTFTDPATVSVQ